MSGNMNLSVNGQSQVPPGFRFHPTEEELLNYYLRKKVKCQKIDLDVIRDVDLNKLEPWDIQEKCKIGSAPQSDWYLFSHKDKKYPSGTRTNRATTAGFWKATGRDKNIYSNLKRIGMRKTLVFYRGRAPHGRKLDWIMHEYRLDDNTHDSNNVSNFTGEEGTEEGWVVCRVFKKKNYHKAIDGGPHLVSCTKIERNDVVIDHTPMHVERSSYCKQESEKAQIIETPTMSPSEMLSSQNLMNNMSDWGAVDQFVASQLNGHNYYFDEQFSSYGETLVVNQVQLENAHHSEIENHQVLSPDMDLWGFARSSATISSYSDPLCYLSV